MNKKEQESIKEPSKRRKKKRRPKTPEEREQSRQRRALRKKKEKQKKIFKFSSGTIAFLVVAVFSYHFIHNKNNTVEVSNQVQNTPKKNIPGLISFKNLNPVKKQELIDKELNTNPLLINWNQREVNQLKQDVSLYSIDPKFTEIAKEPDSGIYSLMANADNYSHVLNTSEYLEATTGYPTVNSTGIILDSNGFVQHILQDSPGDIAGIKKGWQLLSVDNYNSPYFSDDAVKNDQLISQNNSQWRNTINQTFNLSKLQTYPPVGSLASGYFENGVLNIRIQKMTSITPWRVYSIIYNYISKGYKIKGLLIDLRTTAFSANGVPQLTWILNGGKKSLISIATNNQNQSYQILAQQPNFQINSQVINIINQTKKIVAVDNNTKGLTEALAYNLEESGAKLYGSQTYGKNTIENYFLIGNKGVQISSYHFTLPNNITLPLKPYNKINFEALDELYRSK